MGAKVVTIARTMGAGGEEIGREVATALGFRHVDDEIISRAATRAAATPEAVAAVEHSRPLVLRILEMMAAAPPPEMAEFDFEAYQTMRASEQYHKVIADVISEVAGEGNVVIVAHGAGTRLAGMNDALRVFVTAPEAIRVARLKDKVNGDPLKLVKDSDRERGRFLQRFYGVREELPTHYDLVVNTESLSIEQSAALIVVAAREPRPLNAGHP